MLSDTEEKHTPLHALNKIFIFITAFIATGLSILLLIAFYDCLVVYHKDIMKTLYIAFKLILVCGCFYIYFFAFLSIERKNNENNRRYYNPSNIEYDDHATSINSENNRILETYKEMQATNSFSLNKLAMEIYGKKGGHYNKLIRDALSEHNIEV